MCRRGPRLRKLKKSTNGLDGKGKLTDKFKTILELQFEVMSAICLTCRLQSLQHFFIVAAPTKNPCMDNALLDPIHGANTKRSNKKENCLNKENMAYQLLY
ncbi:hypothetical protein TNCV_4747621 [Trichonephila clavipes]|nr:hypothetical protein TNCV_4747621 [Trichonephila clavipes]